MNAKKYEWKNISEKILVKNERKNNKKFQYCVNTKLVEFLLNYSVSINYASLV